MAVSGVSGMRMRRLLSLVQPRSGWNAIRTSLLRSFSASQPSPPFNSDSCEVARSELGNEGLDSAEPRKEYEAKVSSTRENYTQGTEAKKAQEMRDEHVKQQLILESKEEQLAVKKGKAEAGAVEVQKEIEILLARYDAQRTSNSIQREKREKKMILRKERQTEKIRHEYSDCIEKNDVDLKF